MVVTVMVPIHDTAMVMVVVAVWVEQVQVVP